MLEEAQCVMCMVTKIVGTTVFVKIENDGEGTIMTSEIAPGRIRNLRDYVVPNKKIVCKILRIEGNNIHLSLRRVSLKEKKEVLEQSQKEQNALSILKTVLGEKTLEVTEKIKESSSLATFLNNCRDNPKELDTYLNKEQAERVCKILSEKKDKEVIVKKKFSLSSEAEDGILKLKRILPPSANYLGSGKFSIELKDKNYKDANRRMDSILQELEQKAKKENCSFEVEK